MKIGILALQGGYETHAKTLHALQTDTVFVRYPSDLNHIDGLILPGGESTSLRQLFTPELLKAITLFSQNKKPIFGTCAGAILLAKKIESPDAPPFLNLMNIAVKRNAYGRQIASGIKTGKYLEEEKPFSMLFIRAPKLIPLNKNIKTIARCEGENVCLQEDHLLAASFHPELIQEEYRLHQYFLNLVKNNGHRS
jgi:5'-phosphate synthase pdxT subunit